MNPALDKIDFVMIWVDGNDMEWRKERSRYDGTADTFNPDTEVRYRDWDNLQYWFRSVEKFAPWVNRIHFVTWGHIPAWLDTSNPKLNIVNHKDYIPQEYLPTFSSHAIELNLHRIEGLSEQFVYFNDDMFITSEMKPEDFFKNGKPRDTYGMDCIYFNKNSAGVFNGNDMEIINSHFDSKKALRKNRGKWFSPKNGMMRVLKTAMLSMWPWFPGMYYSHLPNSFLKSTLEKVWKEEYEVLDTTCRDKFRTRQNVNQWLFKFWQLAEGTAEPISFNIGKCYHLKEENFDDCCRALSSGKYKLMCINDTERIKSFEEKKQRIKDSFEALLPEKSSFEL